MSILDELTEHFDVLISKKERYGRILAEINAFCEQELNHEQAERLNDLIGELIQSVAAVNSTAGMKLGARIVAGLLADDS